MEKLTPQNYREEHLVQVLLAILQGIPVEYKSKSNDWTELKDFFLILKENTKYRIVPKPTPLPFSREMWQMFSKKWKLATMNKDESISLHTQTSFLNPRYEQWSVPDDAETIDVTDLLAVNTDGINWRLSLTKRPKDV
ncbi:hypothetical protein [Gilliamella sp. Imp1-1]|uniref:hypothetical protein n=1 Tax=Gilliamella sp. Imp1-1 TaxID=3120248 RepID=UPI000461F13C|nr:hypothetical protein [Gilliamella apicola]KDN11130.1 hypothetical protein GAPWKB30_0336 [Gilliamella apicola]OCG56804.1 hypothetical protein A9G38_09445 [Gilliamella apicola]